MAYPNDPWSKLGPDYDPASWSAGYQAAQFGVRQDPAPGNGVNAIRDSATSVLAAMAAAPAVMTTAAEKNVGVTQTSGKSTATKSPDTVTTS